MAKVSKKKQTDLLHQVSHPAHEVGDAGGGDRDGGRPRLAGGAEQRAKHLAEVRVHLRWRGLLATAPLGLIRRAGGVGVAARDGEGGRGGGGGCVG